MSNMAAYDLQRAIFARLTSTTALVTRLGGPRIYDDVPAKPEYPFMTFGTHIEKDWSTGTDEGSEHLIQLHVWSLSKSRQEVSSLLDLAQLAIESMPPTFESFRLVSIRHEQSEIEREAHGSRLKGTVRFKALTEPL